MMATTGPESESRASPGLESGCTANPTTRLPALLPSERGSGASERKGCSIRKHSDDAGQSDVLHRRRVTAGGLVLVRGIAVAGEASAAAAVERAGDDRSDRWCRGARAGAGTPAQAAARGRAASAAAGA